MAITKPIPGSINAPLGSQQESGVNAYGGVNILEVSGLSSDIGTTAVAIATVSNGSVEIENIIFETDSTGLAGGTNVQFGTNAAFGLAVFWAETVANLGASKTIDIYTASVTKQRTVIQGGKTLTIASTVAVCTGAGVWKAYIIYRPCVQTAVLQ